MSLTQTIIYLILVVGRCQDIAVNIYSNIHNKNIKQKKKVLIKSRLSFGKKNSDIFYNFLVKCLQEIKQYTTTKIIWQTGRPDAIVNIQLFITE